MTLFFAGEVAYRWRDNHVLAADRLMASIVLLVLIPGAPAVPVLTVLASVDIAFIGYGHWQRPDIGGVRRSCPDARYTEACVRPDRGTSMRGLCPTTGEELR
jgi:hypothetical protein